MTAMEHDHNAPPEAPEHDPAPQDTLIARLRERREQIVAQTTVDLPVGPYNGELVARYRLLETKELSKIRKKVGKQFPGDTDQQEFNGNADALIAACVGFFICKEDGSLEPLDQAAGYPPELGPITYEDNRLAEQFGFEAESAREALFGLFGKPLASGPHGKRYSDWLTGATVAADEGLLGEA